MAQNKPGRGRVTPKGTRPPHLQLVDVPKPDGSPLDDLIDSGGREILAEDDPIAAEIWASSLLDMFEHARWQARLDGKEAPPFEEALLQRCRQRRDRHALAVAAALASVVPSTYRRLAESVVADLHGVTPRGPRWVGAVGTATPIRSWIASDVFGDQDSLILGFRQEGQPSNHAIVVLIDHNLSGQAKDAWLGPDVDEIVASWTSTGSPHLQIAEIPVSEALTKLRDAMALSDLWNGDTELRTEEFAQSRAMIWARLRRAGLSDDPPPSDGVPVSERVILVRDVVASEEGRRLSREFPDVDVERLVSAVVDLRCDDVGSPLRWSPTVASLILGHLAPRNLLLGGDEVTALPDVVRALVRFSAGRTGLGATFVEEILSEVDNMESEFGVRMADPDLAGPAKAVMTALQAGGVDLTDLDAIDEALEQGGTIKLPGRSPNRRRRSDAAPADVVASAQRSPVLVRFELLADFYGEGRKLTQTGRPTLADAKILTSLLGTRDRIDQTIGDRTFRTTSAANLPELSFSIRWACSAGVLRKEHGKLLATASWRKLVDKPLRRWMKAADPLPALGPLAAFFTSNRYRGGHEILDELAPEILELLEHGPMAFEQVLDRVCDLADDRYEWLSPYMQDPELRRKTFGWDLDRLATILGWAGIVDRVDVEIAYDRYDGEELVGGSLELTRVGLWWLTGH